MRHVSHPLRIHRIVQSLSSGAALRSREMPSLTAPMSWSAAGGGAGWRGRRRREAASAMAWVDGLQHSADQIPDLSVWSSPPRARALQARKPASALFQRRGVVGDRRHETGRLSDLMWIAAERFEAMSPRARPCRGASPFSPGLRFVRAVAKAMRQHDSHNLPVHPRVAGLVSAQVALVSSGAVT